MYKIPIPVQSLKGYRIDIKSMPWALGHLYINLGSLTADCPILWVVTILLYLYSKSVPKTNDHANGVIGS